MLHHLDMRFLRWSLILLQFAWLNILMPGHTRGMVTMEPNEPASQHCCGADRSAEEHGAPTDEDRASCAVCFFAARMTVPPVVDLTLPPMGLAEVQLVEVPPVVAVAPVRPTHDSRGPPAV